MLHPVGDPQESTSLSIRLLDLSFTYWVRTAIPVSPFGLTIGVILAGYLGLKRFEPAYKTTFAGVILFTIWFLIYFVVPIAVHAE